MKDDSIIGGTVWDSVERSVWHSIEKRVYHSVCDSASYSLRGSVLDSIRISQRKSFWDSVWSSTVSLSTASSVRDYFKQK